MNCSLHSLSFSIDNNLIRRKQDGDINRKLIYFTFAFEKLFWNKKAGFMGCFII